MEKEGMSIRSSDDDLGIDKLLVELGVLALLVGGGDEGVAGILEPLSDAKLVLSGSEQLRDLKLEELVVSGIASPMQKGTRVPLWGAGGWVPEFQRVQLRVRL